MVLLYNKPLIRTNKIFESTKKHYYLNYVSQHLREYFPRLVDYTRMVALMPRLLVPLTIYLEYRKGECTGIQFVDSTKLAICHDKGGYLSCIS